MHVGLIEKRHRARSPRWRLSVIRCTVVRGGNHPAPKDSHGRLAPTKSQITHRLRGALRGRTRPRVCASVAHEATIHVTTPKDEQNPNDGLCSLREAIDLANSPSSAGDCVPPGGLSGGRNTIALGAHTYKLTLQPSGSDDNATGDLNITGVIPLTIRGVATAQTAIDASGLGDRTKSPCVDCDRVLTIAAAAKVTLDQLTATGGHSPDGATGSPSHCTPCGSRAFPGSPGANGGGILNQGSLALLNAVVGGNRAGAGGAGGTPSISLDGGTGAAGGSGGGVYNTGTTNATVSTISGNLAGDGGAGGNPGGNEQTGGDGAAGGEGGGLDNENGGTLSVDRSTVTGNHAGTAGAGGSGSGGRFKGGNAGDYGQDGGGSATARS